MVQIHVKSFPFLITYLDDRNRVVARMQDDFKWYELGLYSWKQLSRKPKLIRTSYAMDPMTKFMRSQHHDYGGHEWDERAKSSRQRI